MSLDLGWKHQWLELTGTIFRSRIDDVLLLRENGGAAAHPVQIINAPGAGKTAGTELIARLHHGGFDLIATHMYLRSSEPDPDTGARRDVPLNPRHSAGIDFLWEIEGRARIGLEAFYTGRQHLDDSPYLQSSPRYWLFGVIGEWRVGGARIFVMPRIWPISGRPSACRSSGHRARPTADGWTMSGGRWMGGC